MTQARSTALTAMREPIPIGKGSADLGVSPGIPAQARVERGLFEECLNGSGDLHGVALDKQAVDAVLQDFREAADSGGDYRDGCGQTLQNAHRQPFGRGRKQQRVGARYE